MNPLFVYTYGAFFIGGSGHEKATRLWMAITLCYQLQGF